MTVKNRNVVAIIQARAGSTRLPGKVFKDISGKPMLWHLVNRLKYSQTINEIVIAIPDSTSNDKLASFVKELGVECFRGSEEDVLSRYYGAAMQYKGDVIVRLTSDCPLIDPRITDSVIKAHLSSDVDYTYKGPNSGFPRGLDTEVFPFQALKKTFNEATKDYEREHVTPYIYQHPELFKIDLIQATGKLKRPDLRLTVDTEEDLAFIRGLYQRLYRKGQIFYTENVIDLLDMHPELIHINAQVKQKELGAIRRGL
jgi:spore coat polysaccharide biosynthesis protein SpsF